MVSAWFERAESFSSMPWASFYSQKGLPQWHTGGGKVYSARAYRPALRDKVHSMRYLGVHLALSGTGTRPVPSVAALPRFKTRPGQQCVRCHVGRQADEVARWWSLHEDLHAATQALDELAWELHVATQVPAQLVGLAASCEWRWKLG